MLREKPSMWGFQRSVRKILPHPSGSDDSTGAALENLPGIHCLRNDAFYVGWILGRVITGSRFQETVDDRADEHGAFELDASGLADLETNLVQRVNLPRRQHHHYFFHIAVFS